jgi:hypothetical protein
MSEMTEAQRLLVDYHDQIIKQRERHHEEMMKLLQDGLTRFNDLVKATIVRNRPPE